MLKSRQFEIERALNVSALASFFCGVKSMDRFIHDEHNGLGKYVENGLTNLWIVRQDGLICGFYALSKSSLIINSEDIRNLSRKEEGYYWFDLESSFPSVKN